MMRNPVSALLAGCLLAASCGNDAHERHRVAPIAATGDAASVGAALAEHTRARGAPAAIVADGPAAVAAAEAFARANQGTRVVAIAPKPADAAAFGPIDTVIVDETGAAVAMDMGLLAAGGIELPEQIALGTRAVTRTDFAKGGASRAGPGDFVVEVMRRQHAELLAIPPKNPAVVAMALVQLRADDPRHARVATELVAAAKRHAQVQLDVRAADGDAKKQNDAILEFARAGRRVVFVSTDDPRSLADLREPALLGATKLIVLDPLLRAAHSGFCHLGADQQLLGRAAGEAIGHLVPSGGTIVELHGDLASPLHLRRHQGLLAALEAK